MTIFYLEYSNIGSETRGVCVIFQQFKSNPVFLIHETMQPRVAATGMTQEYLAPLSFVFFFLFSSFRPFAPF